MCVSELMTSILNSRFVPQHLKQLQDWFELEWGPIDLFNETQPDLVVPRPLLAINSKNQLVGGLAFSSFAQPGSKDMGVWVNALFVAPECRGLGIASELIQAAQVDAQDMKINQLYVHTDKPDLYQKLGWHLVDRNGENSVLAIILSARLGNN